jgi:16S rRNA processing protein RimM
MAGDLLLVGRIARAHGNKGQVIVNPETDFAERRFRAGAVLLVGPDARERRIRDVRFHLGRPILGLEGIETIDAAEALAGAELKVHEDALIPLPADTYYHHDLIGCGVCDRQNREIGRVTGIQGPLDRSCLVVEGLHGEVLIPLVAGICVNVDVGAKRIVVDPPEGLLELNARS